jgi:hypothetical protein
MGRVYSNVGHHTTARDTRNHAGYLRLSHHTHTAHSPQDCGTGTARDAGVIFLASRNRFSYIGLGGQICEVVGQYED